MFQSKSEIQNQIIADVKASDVFKNHRWTPLSKIFTICRVLANAIFLFVDSNLVSIFKAIHPFSSDEPQLKDWLIRYGMSWKEAVRARHSIRIGSLTQPTSDIVIPQGTIVFSLSSNSQIEFQLLETVTLPALTPEYNGSFTILATCEALVAGELGNVVVDSISQIQDAPDGIDVVYNFGSPLTAGSERESIESVRNRIKDYENGLNAKWTPNWYISQAQSFSFVKRASFVSSKKLNRPGFVQVLLIGMGYLPISNENLSAVEDFFNSEEQNPGGSAFVEATNASIQSIDKSITVYFADSDSILSQEILNNTLEAYFYSLQEGRLVKASDIRFAFYNLPKVASVVVIPDNDISIPDGTIAVPGEISVIGEVYNG